MHIVIPMSGIGRRFIDAGYTRPKPLIEADGMPIIEHVVNLFPGEDRFTFIVNEEHLRTTDVKAVLERIAPQGNIVSIPPHKKGPVWAVLQVEDKIDDDEEIIVNYCDFGTYWDYPDFLRHTRAREAEGAVVAYKGYHPHMLGPTNYAFIRDHEQWLDEIREKQPFTDDRMSEYASNGTYYFRRGAHVKKYFRLLMERDIQVKGEYYVSMIYNLLVEDGLSVSVFENQHMLQWGTPADLEEYQMWSDTFRKLTAPLDLPAAASGSVNLIPLAGRGSRFANEGYETPKPLIEVSGRPMIVQAAASLPPAENSVFVCLDEHLRKYPLESTLKDFAADAKVVPLDGVTEGQAITVELGLPADDGAPLFVAASDNGMILDGSRYAKLLQEENVDCIALTFSGNPTSAISPQMYGWVPVDGDMKATGVSVKVPISDNPIEDHAIVGAFYFKSVGIYREALRILKEKDIRVNGEFYVDSMVGVLVEAGYDVRAMDVEHYICWGTPNDLKTFNYWQSFFHKCEWHPYRLQTDPMVPADKAAGLERDYTDFRQPHE